MKRLIVDLDGTLTIDTAGIPYAEKTPNIPVIEKINCYKAEGFTIAIHTARNMRTFGSSLGLINAHTLPVVLAWLERHDVSYDEVHVGKPWCGEDGFYIDDRAIRPSEFLRLDHQAIAALLAAERS